MSDPFTRSAIQHGKSIGAKRAAALLAELDAALAAAAELESQLGQAHELLDLSEAGRKRDANVALDELARMQLRLDQAIERNGYLGRLVEILRDVATPAATALFSIGQLPAIDARVKETIQQTLAPLDAALAATKGVETT